MKNQFFFAMVPVVALLAGCPTGPGDGLGEGEGEGEGEGPTSFIGTLDIQAPESAGACDIYVLDRELAYSTLEEFESALIDLEPDCESGTPCSLTKTVNVPTNFYSYIACADHLAVAQETYVDRTDTFLVRWTQDGQCGLAPNGEYLSTGGTNVTISTVNDGSRILITGDLLLTNTVELVVTGNRFDGSNDERTVSGTMNNGVCQILYHEECSTCDPSVKDFTLNSLAASCPQQ